MERIGKGRSMVDDDPEVEIVCPRCGYRTRRTASRLRRTTPVVCAQCGMVVVTGEPEQDGRPE
jgi:DNA-directed RNA polymerase subunit RPC12/RpoP